ncbi:hypothetical protein BKA69DRAFT_1097441 [Paraphysoderma sedebokerense]|nr:hypothetical protein BKA69DRAFT_1097441 [Paraphysoderma sedebokerense]
MLQNMSAGRVNPSTNELLSVGVDLKGPGLHQYILDILYITWFVQLTSMFSDKMWYLYLIIPAYASVKLGGTVFSFLRGQFAGSGAVPSAAQDVGKKKEKRQKVKYFRG